MILALLGIGIAGFGIDATWGDILLYATLWVFVILTGLTVIQRMRKTLQQLPG
jgi:hypothetical protein